MNCSIVEEVDYHYTKMFFTKLDQEPRPSLAVDANGNIYRVNSKCELLGITNMDIGRSIFELF